MERASMVKTDLTANYIHICFQMTNFPKKVFTEEDYEKPLDMLGLVPAAAVIVMK